MKNERTLFEVAVVSIGSWNVFMQKARLEFPVSPFPRRMLLLAQLANINQLIPSSSPGPHVIHPRKLNIWTKVSR